jgi:uncharacterized C2H2 Zn-finger protein
MSFIVSPQRLKCHLLFHHNASFKTPFQVILMSPISNVDVLLRKLNDLPAPDLTNLDATMYSYSFTINSGGGNSIDGGSPIDCGDYSMSPVHAPGEYSFTSVSPTAMTPGEYSMSMVMSPAPMSAQFPIDWTLGMRQRSDSVFESMLPFDYQPPVVVHRTMSLPHIYSTNPFSSQPSQPIPSQSRKSSICSVTSTSSSSNGEKTFVCTHPGCDKVFARVQNLRSHMRCHLTTTPHQCKECGMGFRRTTDLQRHVRTMHTPNDQKPWACPKCPKRFGRSDALKRHLQSKSKDHGCPGDSFTSCTTIHSVQGLPTVVEGSAL